MKGSGLGQIQHSMNNLFLESATMPPNVKDILNRRGDAIVNSIKIGRTPVQSAIQGILKTLSTVPYDDLFHLFMVFNTSKGEILLEKNARINASLTIPKSEDWYDLNDVPKIIMEDEETIDVDFIFDCSGFARLVIGKLYKTDWISYSDRLPVDRAIAFFLEIDKNNIPTYTNATALDYGWMWQVPLQHRYGCGYAYDSSYLSEEDAKKEVEEKIGQEINIVKSFNFNPGVYKEIWKNNCLAVGLASGFLEPIDATSLSQVVTLLENFFLLKHRIFDNNSVSKKEINDYYVNQSSSMSDFVQMHYLTNKTNNEFWLNFEENHPISDSLKDKINKMDNTVLRDDAIRVTFSEHDYYTVWHGMHRLNIDNIKSIYNENKLFLFSEWWNDQKNQELKTVEDLVDHVQFLEYFGGLDS
jgi:hypothetical protein